MKKITTKELSEFNGKEGKAVYIAHEGKVFDVSASKLWQGGIHMQRHHAGSDLTTDLQSAPHGPEVLERYPHIAGLEKEAVAEQRMPAMLARLLKRSPMLRRHPHPMTVHFPIVFMFATTMFTLLYLITGMQTFERTALHCLGAGLLFTPVAMATGYYTWWLNYLSRPMRAVTIKKWLAAILLCIEIIAFIWRISNPAVLAPLSIATAMYLILILLLFPLVVILGWLGASLTFPVKKE
ncbi:MAG: cytochrome b5 [Deltaproteobacteria bacterium RBG_16_54_18]|nr:MAG: cytochrome b5 [Deltaproteobacteria bacterium RBG_16_54_18]